MRKLLLPLLAAFLSMALLGQASAKETPAYIALGDSLAFGVGASDPAHKGYVGLTFDALRRSNRYLERGLTLLNLGVPGATSSDLLLPGGQMEQAIAEIKERQADTTSADDNVEIISVNIGGNDLLALGSGDSPCISEPAGDACQERFNTMLATLEDNLSEVVQRLREAAPLADIVIVDLYNPFSGTGAPLELVADLAVQQVNGVLRKVAEQPQFEAKLADLQPLFQGRSSQLIAADNLHPNDSGYALIAEALLAAIEERAVVLPEGLNTTPSTGGSPPPQELPPEATSAAAAAAFSPPSGSGRSNVGLLLTFVIPASLLGLAVIGGAYVLARGRR